MKWSEVKGSRGADEKLMGDVFKVAGIVLVAVILFWGATETYRFYRTSLTAEGVVTELRAGPYHFNVSFKTQDGKAVATGLNTQSSHYVGEHVVLRYDPEHPEDAVLNTFEGLLGWHVFVAMFGVFFYFAGRSLGQ